MKNELNNHFEDASKCGKLGHHRVVFYVKDTGKADINENYANGDISILAYTMVMCHNGRCPRNL